MVLNEGGVPPVAPYNPYYVRDPQGWAIQQERQSHNQALYTLGEYCIFILMWHLQDYQKGYVARCKRCNASGKLLDDAAAVYGQASTAQCPDCFGTTFEGGWKAMIVRPAIITDTDQTEKTTDHGVTYPSDLSVESTVDFRIRDGDYMLRFNGDRYYLRAPRRNTLRTGFFSPTQSGMAIDYNQARASLEDRKASVAYQIGPDDQMVRDLLQRGRYWPEKFNDFDTARGPLIPPED